MVRHTLFPNIRAIYDPCPGRNPDESPDPLDCLCRRFATIGRRADHLFHVERQSRTDGEVSRLVREQVKDFVMDILPIGSVQSWLAVVGTTLSPLIALIVGFAGT